MFMFINDKPIKLIVSLLIKFLDNKPTKYIYMHN